MVDYHFSLDVEDEEQNLIGKIELDKICNNCTLGTVYEQNKERRPCEVCNGVGYLMTEQGKVILDWLKRHE